MTPWHNNILDCFVTVDRNDIRDVKSLCHYFQRFSVQMEVENQDLANLGPPIKLELDWKSASVVSCGGSRYLATRI